MNKMFNLTTLLACSCVCAAALLPLAVARSYSNGLIFYELATHTPYLPPTVSVSRGRNLASVKYSEKGSIWSTFGQPCECHGPICGCCAGLKVDQYKFDQKVCANITYVPHLEEAQLEVYLNERPSSKYGISVRNPSPFCIPVMMGVPMAMCVQMTDVALVGNNLNMCMDFVVRLATTDLFEMHFQCMRMGLDGLQYVDKTGKPVLPPSSPQADDEDGIEYDYAEEEQTPSDDDQTTEQPQIDTETESEPASYADTESEAETEAEAEPEPLPIESEMLMAGDQELVVSSTATDGDDVEAQEEEDEEEALTAAAEAAPQLAYDDNASESDLKQNEVIETITNSNTANAAPSTTTTDKVEANVVQEPTKAEEQEEEATTTMTTTDKVADAAEMEDDSDNEVNVDDDEEEADEADEAAEADEGEEDDDTEPEPETNGQQQEDQEDAEDELEDEATQAELETDDVAAEAQEAEPASSYESAVKPNISNNNNNNNNITSIINEPSREAVDGIANGAGVKQQQQQQPQQQQQLQQRRRRLRLRQRGSV